MSKANLETVIEMTVKANRRTADKVRAHSDALHAGTREHVTTEAAATRRLIEEAHDVTREAVIEEAVQTRTALAAASGELHFGQVLLALALAIVAAIVTGVAFSGYAVVGDEPYWPVVIILSVAAGALAFAVSCLVAMQLNPAARYED